MTRRRDPNDASHIFGGMLPGTRGTPLPSRRPSASRLTTRPSTAQAPSITRHPTGTTAATIPAKENDTMSAATKDVTEKAGMNAAEFQKAHLAKKAAEAEAKAAAKALKDAEKAAKVAADKAAKAEAAKAKLAEREAAKAAKGEETAAAKAERLEAAAKAKAEKDAAKAAAKEEADAARKAKNAEREAELDRLRKLKPEDLAHCERGNHDVPVKSFPTTRTGAGRSFHECRACRDARVKAAKPS